MKPDPEAAAAPDELAPLMVRVLARDAAALGLLYDRSSARVHAIALRVLRDAHDAEEVVADTYHQAWTRAAQYDPARGSVLRWLCVIAHTRALDRLRRHAADRQRLQPLHPETGEAAYAPGVDLPVADLLDAMRAGTAVHAALAALKPRQRELIALAFLEELPHPEIAARTGLPLGTVKSHIRRGLLALRERIGQGGATP